MATHCDISRPAQWWMKCPVVNTNPGTNLSELDSDSIRYLLDEVSIIHDMSTAKGTCSTTALYLLSLTSKSTYCNALPLPPRLAHNV